MGHISRVILSTFALFALSMLAAAGAASAIETTKVLPEPTAANPVSATGVVGATGRLVLLGGSTLTCRTASGSGTFTSPNLGTGKSADEGCTGPLGATCTGEGDRAGTILHEGTIEYVLALEMTKGTETTLIAAGVTLLREFHFTCESLGVKELVISRGCLPARDDSSEKLTGKVRLLSHQWATGESTILEILPPGATKESSCIFEASVNGGGFTLGALEGEGTLENFQQSGRAVTVLLMDK